MMSKKRSTTKSRRRRGPRRARLGKIQKILLYLGLAAAVLLPIYVFYLNYQVQKQFEGTRWAIPARVYARPLELLRGSAVTPSQFELELRLLGYRYSSKARPGHYIRRGNEFEVTTRSFHFWDQQEESTHLTARFSRIGVTSLTDADTGETLPLVRFDPVMIGSIYPKHKEDRILVKLEQTPELLINALIAIEDKNFFSHFGIDPKGVLRAIWANIKAKRLVQGGSTLTQQLVKNFFLTSERTLWRKFNEAIMATLLEIHYEKNSILEAYCNEIYLGQDGDRAIHGFGLASWFYFQRPLEELKLAEISMLVGMVRGPSYYDPRKHPERAKERRNYVIDALFEMGVVDEDQADQARASELGLNAQTGGSLTRYPAFIDLVRRQLRRDYKDEDLSSEGLQIFTTMDPVVQTHAENALADTLKTIESRYGFEENILEAATVISSVEGGEVQAVVGGRFPRYAGFNRALDAVRQVGSLIKPAVFLTALERTERYSLYTLLNDGPFVHKLGGGKTWTPQNYDKEYHGMVPLQTALAKSYNIATARLGLEVGVDNVLNTVERLGVDRKLNPFPSVLLGAADLTPLEVTQMYQTMASGGFQAPMRAIREVLTAKGVLLQRYELDVERNFKPKPIYLINRALQETVASGTGQGVYRVLPRRYHVAGKTGTTDDLRDSWFAGFTGNYVGTVWVGRDDNKSAGLTGASGALRVWTNIFAGINIQELRLRMPSNVRYRPEGERTDMLADQGCPDGESCRR